MKLIYHQGANFGDAINPIIFNHYVNDVLEQKDNFELFGIGSILGLKRPSSGVKKAVVFSSGFAAGAESTYGKLPSGAELEKYDFRCVRGPLTCKKLGLHPEKGIADGAILLSDVLPNSREKKYSFAYMPHVGSLDFYSNWKGLIESLGIKFINPSDPVQRVLTEVQETEVLICEAMHGAIIADTYRIPWIPIKTNTLINDFKWNDYCKSLSLSYNPQIFKTLYDKETLKSVFEKKLEKVKLNNTLTSAVASNLYFGYQKSIIESSIKKQFLKLKKSPTTLSKSNTLNEKKEQLLSEIHLLKKDYSNN